MESSTAECWIQCSMMREDGTHSLSRWKVRKAHAKHMRDSNLLRCKSLELENEALRARVAELEHMLNTTPIPVKLDNHRLNLEQYSEDYLRNVNILWYWLTCRLSAVASTVEPMPPSKFEGGVTETKSVPSGSPRDTHNGLQCQICKKVFKSKTALREHLGRECLAGKLDRSATPDRSHRRRWNTRERKRSVGRGGSRAEKTSISRGGSQTKVSQTKADEVSRGICEASEKTCEICASDYNVGKEGRWLPCGHVFHASCIEEWVRICRSRHLSPKCLNCNANVHRPE